MKKVTEALFALASVSPAHAGQCLDLIRHIQTGSASAFAPKAQALIAQVLESDVPMTAAQKATLEAACKGYNHAEISITLQGIMAAYGVSMTKISERFGIPYRTVQNWAGGERKAPEYVLRMMDEILSHDRLEKL